MKGKSFSYCVKQFVILSVNISMILHWCRMKKVSKEVEDVIVSRLCHCSNTKVAARELGLSQSCIQRIKQQRLSSLKCPPQGRSRVLSSRQKKACAQAVTVRGKENASKAVKDLWESEGVNVSGWTMKRALKRVGLSSRVKLKKPKLFSKHIRDCLDFTKRHRNWIVSDWKRVIFSDECKTNRFNSDGQSWY